MSKIQPHCMGMAFPEKVKKIGHLKINGRALQPRHSRAEERLRKYLESMADDELMHVYPLARAGGFGSCTILGAQEALIEAGLAHRDGARVYYGNKRAIESLRALLAQSKP